MTRASLTDSPPAGGRQARARRPVYTRRHHAGPGDDQEFPERGQPDWGPDNRQQFSALTAYCEVEVLATIAVSGRPAGRALVEAGRLFTVPRRDRIAGLEVLHPRTLFVPKLPSTTRLLYAASVAPYVARYRGRIDVILASWAYPDGWAAVVLAGLGRARGGEYLMRTSTWWPGCRAAADVALGPAPRRGRGVCEPRAGPRDRRAGGRRGRIAVVYNGVTAALFRVADRAAARAELGLPPAPRIIVSVANLKRQKGVLDFLDGSPRWPHRRDDIAVLVLVGEGDDRERCEQPRPAAIDRGGDRRVILAGARPTPRSAAGWRRADSSPCRAGPRARRASPMEALACGRRVVATTVGGIPDLVAITRARRAGRAARPAGARRRARPGRPRRGLRPGRDRRRVPFGDWHASAGRLYGVLEQAVG